MRGRKEPRPNRLPPAPWPPTRPRPRRSAAAARPTAAEQRTVRPLLARPAFANVLVDEYQDTQPHPYGPDQAAGHGRRDHRAVSTTGPSARCSSSARPNQEPLQASGGRFPTILMGFPGRTFGDPGQRRSPRTMVKLRRTTAPPHDPAAATPDRPLTASANRPRCCGQPREGEHDHPHPLRRRDSAEGRSVVHRLRMLEAAPPRAELGRLAILYRTNAQSRAMEGNAGALGHPLQIVVGGLRFFYDRQRDQGQCWPTALPGEPGRQRPACCGC